MKFAIKRLPVLTGKPMYGRIFAVTREGRTVMKISVVPVLSDGLVRDYMVKMSTAPEPTLGMTADQALELSQVLSAAYSHARRLEGRYQGKPFSPGSKNQ